MAIKVRIMKCFHRDTLAFCKGATHDESMTFVDWNDAKSWVDSINSQYLRKSLPYHIRAMHFPDSFRFYLPVLPSCHQSY